MQPATPDKRSAPAGADKPRPDPEYVARVVSVAWTIVSGRLPWPSHIARLHDLEDAGLVNDDAYFGTAVPSW